MAEVENNDPKMLTIPQACRENPDLQDYLVWGWCSKGLIEGARKAGPGRSQWVMPRIFFESYRNQWRWAKRKERRDRQGLRNRPTSPF